MQAEKHLIGEDDMTYVMVDIESDGPIPGDNSMVCFGAVIVEADLSRTFYGKLKPISEKWIPEALKVSGFTRNEVLQFDVPLIEMTRFDDWLKENVKDRPMFISDNNGFDWQFINWYFHHFLEKNPFGFSSTNLGSLYKGMVKDMSPNFKYLRKTRHSHNPVDDAIGNAEALLYMKNEMDLKIKI
jgi:DNA polymerase III epsilon subunit-like protein